MRVLFLTQIIPYPPDAGPRVKTWHVLRYLASRGHQVTLASFVREDELPHVAKLNEVCTAVHTVPMRRSRLRDGWYFLRSNFTQRPFLIERDDLMAMRQSVQHLIQQEQPDVIHADQLTMTQFALDTPNTFTIFDAHNATWSILERTSQTAHPLLRPVLRLEAQRIQRYEAMLVRRFSHTMVVIDPDRDALLQGVPEAERPSLRAKMSVTPIAVDTADLQPIQRDPASTNILTLGSLNYPPNADGIRWFAREVFPRIVAQFPAVTLTIIGKNPPADLQALHDGRQIHVTGYVPDLTPYMAKAAVVVVPVRAGSGMRVRLLEAFARAMPSVTTTIGLEGIEAVNGREVLVADDPASFAEATLRLLKDKALQDHLAVNGRSLAERQYDWQIALQKMDAIYKLVSSGRDETSRSE